MPGLTELGNKQDLSINQDLYEVLFRGKEIQLTSTEFDLLVVLHSEANRVTSRSELLERVWGDTDRANRVVDTFVSRLRTKLQAAGHPGIGSVRKRGYRLLPPDTQASAE